MVKVVRFNLSASTLLIVFIAIGCAHTARELPPDMSNLPPANRLLSGDVDSPEYSWACPVLKAELESTRAALSHIETQLQSTQDQNLSKGIVGVLVFTPALITMEDNETLKNKYHSLDTKRELLLRIAQARQCPL